MKNSGLSFDTVYVVATYRKKKLSNAYLHNTKIHLAINLCVVVSFDYSKMDITAKTSLVVVVYYFLT